MGSKARHGREILALINTFSPILNTVWVEPFVGGCNMLQYVSSYSPKGKVGVDINPHLISLWRAVEAGWSPPDFVSEEEYHLYKAKQKDPPGDPMIAFVGIGCAYAGKWYGGYARGKNHLGNPRNYALEAKNNILAKVEALKGSRFEAGDYSSIETLVDLSSSIVYCDPPYRDTTKYSKAFDYDKFYEWCLKISKTCPVYVSEYYMPEGWKCIWEKNVNSSLTKETGSKKATEKLFTLNSL